VERYIVHMTFSTRSDFIDEILNHVFEDLPIEFADDPLNFLFDI